MRCKQHPKYAAKRHPVKTVQHPDGCPTCWGVWEAAKSDPKRLARTVSVEVSLEEARVTVLELSRYLDNPILKRLYQSLALAVKERSL